MGQGAMAMSDEFRAASLPALGVGVFSALRQSLATIVTYAYSRRDISSRWSNSPFLETAQQQAERACIEMAALGRALVSAQPAPAMSKEYIEREGTPLEWTPIGWIDKTSGERESLNAHDAFDKIIHAARFDWGFDDGGEPLLVCYCPDEERAQYKWIQASIRIADLTRWWSGRSV
jgi:hypothetical protein